MKLLFLGLLPVLIFYFVEDYFGTFWGLIAAIVWAIGEVIYEYARTRAVDRLTLMSTALVVVLGGLGALLDNSVLFKFQPVIVELVFAGILLWKGRGGRSLLFEMARKSRPETFTNMPPEILERYRILMNRLTKKLVMVLIVHCVVMSYVALYGSTGQWAFWKGVGFNVFILFWGGIEFLVIRRQVKKQRQNLTRSATSAAPHSAAVTLPRELTEYLKKIEQNGPNKKREE